MQDEQMNEKMSGEFLEFERHLAGLTPRASATSRDGLMFECGRRSARGRNWAWQGLAACLAVALVAVILSRPAPVATERIVYLPAVPVAPEIPAPWPRTEDRPPPGEDSYFALRDKVLSQGIDALPPPKYSGPNETDPAPGDLMRKWNRGGELPF